MKKKNGAYRHSTNTNSAKPDERRGAGGRDDHRTGTDPVSTTLTVIRIVVTLVDIWLRTGHTL